MGNLLLIRLLIDLINIIITIRVDLIIDKKF